MNPMDQVRRAKALIDTGAGVGITVEKMLKRGDAESVMAGILTTILFNPDEDEVEKASDVLDDAVADFHDETVAKARADHAEVKARRRRKAVAVAEQRAAEQRATTKHQRWETDMDRMLTFARAVAAGAPTTITKAQFFEEMDRRAQADRKPGESVAKAFSRFAETDDGKMLLSAHRLAPGPDYVFERPAPTAPVRKAGAAMDKLMQLAADHRQANPGVTPEAAFAAVYTDPANKDVVAQHKAEMAEQSSVDAARHWPGVAQTFRPAGAQEHTARVS